MNVPEDRSSRGRRSARRDAVPPIALLGLLWTAPLSAQTAPASPWCVLFEAEGGVHALPLDGGLVVEASSHDRVRVSIRHGDGERSSDWSTPSPDASRIAHTFRDWPGSRIAVSRADGSNVVLLTEQAAGHEPVWFPDSRRLLYHRERTEGERTIGESVVHDVDANTVTLFGDQQLMGWARPVFLVDGHVVYVRERTPAAVFDLVVANPARFRADVVLQDIGHVHELAATPNGMSFWLIGEDVRRVDRLTRRVTHRWAMSQLAKPAWDVCLCFCCMRPDGEAVAISLWPAPVAGDTFGGLGPVKRSLGMDHLVLIDLAQPEKQQVSHLVGMDWMRPLGFCRRSDLTQARR